MSVLINGSAGVTTNSGAVYDGLQSGTAVTASGTSIDFTSIPSWVKRITVNWSGVSTSGTSFKQMQIGTSSGVETTGYSSASYFIPTPAASSATTGFLVASNVAAETLHGSFSITLLNSSTNLWCITGGVINNTGTVYFYGSSGSKALSSTLDRVRITTVNGTDTFDAGNINIIYE